MTVLENKVDAINSKVNARIDAVDAKIRSLDARVDARVDTVEAKVADIHDAPTGTATGDIVQKWKVSCN